MLKAYSGSKSGNGLPLSQLDFRDSSDSGSNAGSAAQLGQAFPQSAPLRRRAARFAVPPPSKSMAGLASACLYGAVAVLMNFVNRYTLLAFPMPTVVLMLQMLATVVILHPLLLAGKLDFPHFSWQRCKQLLLISVLYTGNTAFALFGLRTMNIPMYSTLKRLTPMMVLVCKSITSRRLPQPTIACSVALVVLGCIVAGYGDLSFNLLGYVFALCSCLAQSAYLLLVENQGGGGSSTSELLYYNAITSIPLLGSIMLLDGDVQSLWPTIAKGSAKHGLLPFLTLVLTCSIMGCLLNYSLFLCTMHNSALTTTIVGVLKGVVAVGLGFVFDQVRYSPVNLAGVSLNMAGGMWYTVHKYRSRRQGVRRAMIASASAEPLSILASMEDGSGSKLHMPAAPAKSSRLSQGHVMGNAFNGGANGMYMPVPGDEQDEQGATSTGQGHLLSPRQRHTATHDQQ